MNLKMVTYCCVWEGSKQWKLQECGAQGGSEFKQREGFSGFFLQPQKQHTHRASEGVDKGRETCTVHCHDLRWIQTLH